MSVSLVTRGDLQIRLGYDRLAGGASRPARSPARSMRHDDRARFGRRVST